MPTATINSLYIESLYIDNNNDNGMLTTDGYNGASGGDISDYSLGNHLTGASSTHSDLNLNYGSKWVIQLTNGSGSDITFNTGSNKWWLRIDIAYKNSSNGFSNYSSVTTKRFYIEGGTLSNGASLYLGWGNTDTSKGIYGIASGISDISICSVSSNVPTGTLDGKLIPPVNDDQSISAYRLLSDQIDGNGHTICISRFILYKSSSFKDFLGVASTDNDGNGLNYSPKRYILFTSGANNTGSSRSISTGAISRDPTQSGTVPTTTFDSTKFIYRSGNGDGILAGTAVGDPHIKTLFGVNYKFDHLGPFRMFDNNASDIKNRIVINGYSNYGEEIRWGNNQYVRKIFILCGNKNILIDTGFRGELVNVLENIGIDYEIEKLKFDEEARIHCFDCRKNFAIHKFNTYSVQNHIKKTCHKVLKPVRNNIKITLKIDNKVFSINISNVNKYNLQPCRINVKPMNIIDNTFSGTLIHRKYAITCAIPHIKNIDKIENPDNIYLNLPSLETQPIKIDKKFY
jgi:hypothetical protein